MLKQYFSFMRILGIYDSSYLCFNVDVYKFSKCLYNNEHINLLINNVKYK